MQHPVGYTMNKAHQPQLNDIWAVLTNPVFVWGYAKVLLVSLVTAAAAPVSDPGQSDVRTDCDRERGFSRSPQLRQSSWRLLTDCPGLVGS